MACDMKWVHSNCWKFYILNLLNSDVVAPQISNFGADENYIKRVLFYFKILPKNVNKVQIFYPFHVPCLFLYPLKTSGTKWTEAE